MNRMYRLNNPCYTIIYVKNSEPRICITSESLLYPNIHVYTDRIFIINPTTLKSFERMLPTETLIPFKDLRTSIQTFSNNGTFKAPANLVEAEAIYVSDRMISLVFKRGYELYIDTDDKTNIQYAFNKLEIVKNRLMICKTIWGIDEVSLK